MIKDPKNSEDLPLVWKTYMGGDYKIYNKARTLYTASFYRIFNIAGQRDKNVGYRICIEEKDDKRS